MSEIVYYNTATLSGAIFSGAGTGLVTPNSFQSNVQTFIGSGTSASPFTWIKPFSGSHVLVECWGGGGATNGGGGGYTAQTLGFSTVSSTVAVSVGGGGAHPAGSGGNSTFGPYGTGTVTGYGGGGNFGGGGGISSAGATGPAGAGGGPSLGWVRAGNSMTGGSGANVFSPTIASRHGAFFGGGSGGPINGGISIYGGGGGGGTTAGTSAFGGPGGTGANPGVIPGGGGGPTGNGGAGQVRVTVF